MNEKYLPIGTVCRLKDGQKNLMIIGFCQSSGDNPNQIYDYNGCLYPEGVVSTEVNFLFNHDQIEEIINMGLINQEEINFKARLKEFLETGKIDGKDINVDENGNVTLGDGTEEQSSVSNSKKVVNDALAAVQAQQQNIVDQSISSQNSTMQSQGPAMFSTLNLNQQDNSQQGSTQ